MNLPSHLADRLNLPEQLCEATPQGLWRVDEVGTTTAVNPAMYRMLGRDAQAMIGHDVFEMLQAEDALLLRQSLGQPGECRRPADLLRLWRGHWRPLARQARRGSAAGPLGPADVTASLSSPEQRVSKVCMNALR